MLHLLNQVNWSPELWKLGLNIYADKLRRMSNGSPELKEFGKSLYAFADGALAKGSDHDAHLFHGGAFFARWSVNYLRRHTESVS